MNKSMLLFSLVVMFTAAGMGAQERHWYKGNTHTHTINSDGDELPRRVVRWYLDNNYHFLVITDHDHVTPIRTLDTDPNDDFILIQGEEVTDSFNNRPVHLCAIGLGQKVPPQKGQSVVETLQRDIDAILSAGGIAQINHPNWKWAFGEGELSAVKGAALLEIYNLNRDCNNFGAGGRPGMEEIWDRVLSRGVRIWGVASDDTHSYLGDFLPSKATPGKAWIMVRAPELTAAAIMKSLEQGDFYASDGVQLSDVRIGEREYALEIAPEGDATYTTYYIGAGGKVLKTDFSSKPVYVFRGDEGYVRARVISSRGEFACTQPVFIAKNKE